MENKEDDDDDDDDDEDLIACRLGVAEKRMMYEMRNAWLCHSISFSRILGPSKF